MRFWIDIENASGDKQGGGPIWSALHWRSVKRLDRAGEFSFEVPATDRRSSLVQSRYVARCFAVIDGVVTEVGAGRIDSISVRVAEDGQPLLVVSGPDLLAELRQVVLDQNSTPPLLGEWPEFKGTGEDDIPQQIIDDWVIRKLGNGTWALADKNGISFDEDPVTDTDIYAKFRHESALAALIAVAQSAGEHFRLGTGKVVEWVKGEWDESGIHAVYGALNPVAVEERTEIAQIATIEKITDSRDIVNRVFLYGAGEGHSRLDLSAVSKWPDGTNVTGVGPYTWDGYALVKDATNSTYDYSSNFLEDTISKAEYSPNEMALTFKNISPISNTTADVTNAANQLLRSGFQWLKTRSNPQEFYQLSLRGVQGAVKVGQTLQVTARRYVDGQEAIDIDETLNVLEATTEVAIDGLRTVGLMVSTTDRQPSDDASVLVDSMAEAVVSQAHQQIGPAGWTDNHVEGMDGGTDDIPSTGAAKFYFWLGPEIVQVQQILLRFRVDALRTYAKVEMHGLGDGQQDEHKHLIAFSPSNWPSGDAYTQNDTFNHTHITRYGLYTGIAEDTYGHEWEGDPPSNVATLERVNQDLVVLVNGSPHVKAIEDAEDTWFSLDVTADLTNDQMRPEQEKNTIAVQKRDAHETTGFPGEGSTAQITFKLQVRCSMQSVNYS